MPRGARKAGGTVQLHGRIVLADGDCDTRVECFGMAVQGDLAAGGKHPAEADRTGDLHKFSARDLQEGGTDVPLERHTSERIDPERIIRRFAFYDDIARDESV